MHWMHTSLVLLQAINRPAFVHICVETYCRLLYRQGSHVFTCFLDFSKAFDKVNYWKLFNKLLDDKYDSRIVKLLAYWYSHQEACVRWHNNMSQFFTIGVSTRQL
jgi:hypothetical protein